MELQFVNACIIPRRLTTEVLNMVDGRTERRQVLMGEVITDVGKETLQCFRLAGFDCLN